MGKLTRLELNDFKSYRGHHTLNFGSTSYFTSIIGPNGSGKSNSMDAISFVLGVKSAHLRSSHLKELIHRGRALPDASDPTSAWVMAVYVDDDGVERRWMRSITSAGTSEYRLDGRSVTWADYNKALEAEHILVKARNFLVFQGDVEAVASQSPKDLTRLVEQISGSLEFKADYDRLQGESEAAAEDQAYKHNTRRGINAEIKQYADQKKEADAYHRKVEERDDAIVRHVLWKLYHFQRIIEESGAEIQKHQDDLREHRRKIDKYEKNLESAKQEQARVDRDVKKAERSIRDTEKQIAEQQNSLVPIDEKIDLSMQRLQKFQQRAQDVGKERDNQSKAVQQLKKDLATVQKAQSKWEADWAAQAKQQGKQLNDADVQEYNRLKVEVNKASTNAQIDLDTFTRQRRVDEDTVNSLKSTLQDTERQLEKHNESLAQLRSMRERVNAQIKQISKDIDEKKKQYNATTSERLKTNQQRTELEEKLQAVLNRLFEADDGRRASQKEQQMKETVKAMKRIFPGVHGRVHELCKPKQKKFETAMTVALGRHLDSIVVDTDKTAHDCINYLREQRVGSATFIPMDSVQTKAPPSNLKGMHKNMRLALDTIDFDSVYERALSYALGSAMICDDIETARYLCYEKHVEAKAVTLDGTIIHKGGNMTGGRGQQDRNTRKWEDSDVDNLVRLRDNILAEIAKLPRAHENIAKEEALQGELAGLESSLVFAREEAEALKKNIESTTSQQASASKNLKEIKPKYKESSSALEKLKKRIDEAQGKVSEVEDQVFAGFCKRLKYDNIRTYEAQQGSLQQEAEEKKLEFSTQCSRLENQLQFESRRLESTTQRVESIEEQGARDQKVISSLEAEKEAIQAQIDELGDQVDKVREKVEGLRKTLDERAEKVADARRELQKRSKEVEHVSKQIAELEAEVQRHASSRYALLRKCKIEQVKLPLETGSSSLEVLPADDIQGAADPDAMDVDGPDPDVSSLQTPAVQDFGISVNFDSLDDDLKDNDSPEVEKDLTRKMGDLDEELSTLNPNMRASERLDTANERLQSTEEEFEAARTRARETRESFEEIRTQRAELFQRAFDHIAAQIGPVYKELTRSATHALGGNAYLDVMEADEEAPFLGGLKYHAMPPAKRFRDMDALSGGEKTIAALALLFAIHSFAPSPFFVLDEVDAALDSANVAKVARYVKEHAGPGMQFIIISLKAGFFQESESLCGIMRDQTVNSSRVVTLDLTKYRPN